MKLYPSVLEGLKMFVRRGVAKKTLTVSEHSERIFSEPNYIKKKERTITPKEND